MQQLKKQVTILFSRMKQTILYINIFLSEKINIVRGIPTDKMNIVEKKSQIQIKILYVTVICAIIIRIYQSRKVKNNLPTV